MAKALQYYYPDESAPSEVKIMQRSSSQIKALFFTRYRLKSMLSENSANHYTVYFLFDQPNIITSKRLYIGQSQKGIGRIQEHVAQKDFWQLCIMFVTDNDSFDLNAIDFLEHYFIHLFDRVKTYELENKDKRTQAPKLKDTDRISCQDYIEEIEFLLKAEGVRLMQSTDVEESLTMYPLKSYPKGASIYYKEGKYYLSIDSIVGPARSKGLSWASKLKKRQDMVTMYWDQGYLQAESEADTYKVVQPIAFDSPSAVAEFVLGCSTNGRKAFEGIRELLSSLSQG